MEQIKITDLFNYSFLNSLKVCPNDNLFSFIKTKANQDKNRYDSYLYLSDGKNHRKLLNLNNNLEYEWLDQEHLIFIENKNDSGLLYTINIHTKERKNLSSLPFTISKFKKINHDTLAIISLLDPGYFNEKDNKTNSEFYEVFESIPFQSNGRGFINDQVQQLFILNIYSNDFIQITDFSENLSSFEYSKELNEIIYAVTPNTPVKGFKDKVKSFELTDNKNKTLYNNRDISISKIIILNEKIYLMASDMKNFGINQNPSFYELTNNSLILIDKFGYSAWNSIGSDVRYGSSDNSHVIDNIFYFVGTFDTGNRVYRFDGKNVKKLYDFNFSIDGWIPFKNHFMAIQLTSHQLQEIVCFQRKSRSITVLSSFNSSYLDKNYIANPIHETFQSNGNTLNGWVLLPNNFEKNKNYPAILNIHGGPKTIYSNIFYHEMQVWANLGYIVFFCNPHGGDYGSDKDADIRGKYGKIDFEDIMIFTDYILDKYPIKRDKVGVTGGSYGGFMTNWIVGHTDQFAAAATQRSISNWISFHGTSDIGYYFADDQTNANPYSSIDKMWEQSPLKYVQNVKTPLLFIHSDEDYRCPIEQAMQFYTAVKEQGVDSRFVWFKGENHDLSRSGKPLARIKRLEEITNWMEKYLK